MQNFRIFNIRNYSVFPAINVYALFLVEMEMQMGTENEGFISGAFGLLIFGLGVFLLVIYPFMLFTSAAKKKTVIFYDGNELWTTILAPVIFFVAAFAGIYSLSHPVSTSNFIPWIVSLVIGLALLLFSLLLFFQNFAWAIEHARDFKKGMIVGVYKFGFALMAVVFFPLWILNWIGRKMGPNPDNYLAQVTSKALPAFYLCIINGEETYKANGWEIPSEETVTSAE